jgi:hypothetical protein
MSHTYHALKNTPDINTSQCNNEGRDSVVCRGWTVPGSNPGREKFPHQFRPAVGSTPSPVQWIPGIFSGGKAAELWR